MPLDLSTPVKFIKRVGDRVAAGLSERGVLTVEDLLYHLPFRYEDRLHPRPLSTYNPGDMASLIGEVRGTILLRARSGPIFEMTVGITPPPADSAEAMQGLLQPPPPLILEAIKCLWFHGTYLKDKFHAGQRLALYGKLEASRSGVSLSSRSGNAPTGSTKFKMIQPTFEILPDPHSTGEDAEFTMLEMGRIVPVYESLGGKTPWGAKLTSRWHRRVLWTVFRDLAEAAETNPTTPDAPSVTASSSRVRSQTATPAPQTNSATTQTNTAAQKTNTPAPANNPVILSEGSRGSMREPQPKDLPALQHQNATQPLSATTPGAPSVTAPSSRVSPHHPPTETLPHALLQRLNLPTRLDAFQHIHFPPAGTPLDQLQSARTPAHRRLIFEEFFYLELGLELKRRRLRDRSGPALTTGPQVREALKQILPFKPTSAQKRVLGEIVTDMRRSQPMRRLLQGDVGSGKTIVAFQAALVAIENGFQVALMAPTEILATQHFLSARRLLAEKLSPRTARPYRIALLTGSLDPRSKRETRNRIARGEVDLAIGTHALVEDNVDFDNLGLVIVDEQHRFGVQQRFQLMRKPKPAAASHQHPSHLAPLQKSHSAPLQKSHLDPLQKSHLAPLQKSHPDPLQKSVILSEGSRGSMREPQPKDPPARQHPNADDPFSTTTSPATPTTGTATRSPFPGAPSVTASSSRVGSQNFSPQNFTAQNLNPATRSPSPNAPSAEPHVLVMTATPIPRTLALTVYGDMEASILDELPPGRTPITTRRMPADRSSEVWDFLRKQVALGRQAYIVYPIIEGEKDDQPELDFATDPSDTSISIATDTPAPTARLHTSLGQSPRTAPLKNPLRAEGPASPGATNAGATNATAPKSSSTKSSPTTNTRKKPTRPNLRSATEMHAHLQLNELAGLRLGLLHGRMSADDKEVTMARFKRGELDVLVATTVIEVGVDVPNATVMVIEHAERFGLAQMHQLRGRVGRGAAKSFCILLTGAQVSPEAELRLDAMVHTQDGFLLAELDLQQRGPGEFFGTRQAGLPDLRIANLARDRDLLELGKQEAAAFVHTPDPAIPRSEREAVWARLKLHWQRRYGLVEA